MTRKGSPQRWVVAEVLVPIHPKIRISFNDLRIISQLWLIPEIQRVFTAECDTASHPAPTVRFTSWLERGHEYVQRLLREQLLDEQKAIDFCSSAVLPRYVGVLRFESDPIGMIDALIDTTSPRPNYHWIGIVAKETQDDQGRLRHIVAEYLSELCRCEYHR